jgi:histidinol phosphatase-like PHP family hydrolase
MLRTTCFPIVLLLIASANAADKPTAGDAVVRIGQLKAQGFPVVDYHSHLKGGLTLDALLAHAKQTGIAYGVAPNCGKGFPITADEGIREFVKSMRGNGVLLGMQAEGREWVTMFSKEAVAEFDYVFSDAMTFTDHRGKRVRLWIKEEVDVPDKQAFMELLLTKIVGILDNEPIDIYVNPTFLPDVIAKDYDALWTKPRMERVIDAAVRNGVAIEINARYRLPSPAFIKLAKSKGAKFSFGTNNGDRDLGQLEYCLEMIKECGLTAADMFTPKPDGKKPVQVKGFKK